MKCLYALLFFVTSVVLFFLATFETEHSIEGVQFCKKAISKSQPYGLNLIITDPEITNNSHRQITFDWRDLTITSKEGIRATSVGRCTYNKADKEIVFLSIYTDNLISNYSELTSLLPESSSEEALTIAKNLGLNDRQISWIKENGARAFFGQYNPDQEIVNLPRIYKTDLLDLDKMNVINLYPDKNLTNQFLSVKTKLSFALSNSLR